VEILLGIYDLFEGIFLMVSGIRFFFCGLPKQHFYSFSVCLSIFLRKILKNYCEENFIQIPIILAEKNLYQFSFKALFHSS
jgi:hypothetical protein